MFTPENVKKRKTEPERRFVKQPSKENLRLVKTEYDVVNGEEIVSSKLLKDPIYGEIIIPDYCLKIIDTPQFQRLRDLKQLGVTNLVFPTATHTRFIFTFSSPTKKLIISLLYFRFEHSLGVCHLAGKMVEQLQANQPSLDINQRDLKLVRIAGLCHDLGHGPFSHAFELWARKKDPLWSHEKMSLKLFEHLLDDNKIDMEKKDVEFVKALISGKPKAFVTANFFFSPSIYFNLEKRDEKAFLFDIVANSRNSIDVDKFDYLCRDGFSVGLMNQMCEPSRLILTARVIDNQICFHSKDAFTVYSILQTRYTMFKQVYCHRVSKAVECMLVDILDLADPVLDITSKLNNVEEFVFLYAYHFFVCF